MTDSRIVTIRKSENVDPTMIAIPLLFVRGYFGYSVESILRDIHPAPDVYLGNEPNTFPNTIEEYYWIQEGIPGKTQWIAVGKLTNEVYFLYKAFMKKPTNTFVNNGQMDLWVSTNYSDLIKYAMDSSLYATYISSTL
jgi:hypothetical protein